MRIALAAALVLAAGCATAPPSRYLTLDMRPSGGERPPVNLVVGRLTVAQALSGREILIQVSPTEIEYYAAAQWVASPGELVADKLRAEFPTHQDPRYQADISGTIKHFEQVDIPGGAEAHVRLMLRWTLEDFDADRRAETTLARINKTYEARLAVPSGSSGLRSLAETLSRCVEDIAAQLAVDMAAALPGD